jgi:hypothetical protein
MSANPSQTNSANGLASGDHAAKGWSQQAGNNKKQATPSQKRLQKQQRQQQQQKQQLDQNGNQTGPQASRAAPTGGGGGVEQRKLDAKVDKLTDKSECCKQKISLRLEEFAKRASEIKADIGSRLERQTAGRADEDQVGSTSVERLREQLAELSSVVTSTEGDSSACLESSKAASSSRQEPEPPSHGESEERPAVGGPSSQPGGAPTETAASQCRKSEDNMTSKPSVSNGSIESPKDADGSLEVRAQNLVVTNGGDNLTSSGCFEPLSSRLDPKTKFVALKTSLERHFVAAPELLEPICNKLVNLSRQIEQLKEHNECQQQEIDKLRLIKDRLGDLCRELQKSNNQIRIESLSLIKSEQHKAKEQADKIQTTLAGVMKLFDENQQRNMSLKQENLDLQTKLKQLLEHCQNWEQCVETAIKQRDIENRLLKTDLARLNLVKAEEQERYLKEKKELLKAIETMRSHQSRVADKEAKLRSDLSSYANKYDQCQELIQDGLGKFQVESKRMLKQIERSRQDYVTLLSKYETSNKKIKQLLEEKQAWMKSTAQTNKKLAALEKLCRSLKSENDRLAKGAGAGDSSETGGGSPSVGDQRVPLVVVSGDQES